MFFYKKILSKKTKKSLCPHFKQPKFLKKAQKKKVAKNKKNKKKKRFHYFSYQSKHNR